MTAPFRVVLAVTIVVSALSAQGALSVFPFAPTSADPVTLRVPLVCSVNSETVTRTGTNIQVVLVSGGCPSPPLPYAYEVSLGTLPAGRYDVEVTTRTDLPPESHTFIVLNADPAVTVRPFVVPTDTPGFVLRLTFVERELPFCGQPTCSDLVVDIGGVKYRFTDQVSIPHAGLAFNAPDLEPGLHDITITSDLGTTHLPAAIYYHPPGGSPDSAIFERVLFPVLFRAGGAHGSDWRSEAVISNPTPVTIENANTVEPPMQCLVYPCGERLAPGERRAFTGVQYPRGVALMVPRAEADHLGFGLRVRDVSRETDGFGTEVPVVRESEMFRDAKLALMDVPLDPRYRVKLRLYQFRDPIFEDQPNANDVAMRIVLADGTLLPPVAYDFVRACSGVACTWTPYFAELDLPVRAEGDRADIHIEFMDGALGWAFASVTNNATQQVTVVTP